MYGDADWSEKPYSMGLLDQDGWEGCYEPLSMACALLLVEVTPLLTANGHSWRVSISRNYGSAALQGVGSVVS